MNSHLDDKIHSLSRRGETKVDGNVETRNKRELKPTGICDGLEISRGTRSDRKATGYRERFEIELCRIARNRNAAGVSRYDSGEISDGREAGSIYRRRDESGAGARKRAGRTMLA